MSEASTKPKNKPNSILNSAGRIKTSIKHDPIHPKDYLTYNMPWACEDCTHFDSEKVISTIGYQTHWHLKDYQKHTYELSGRMALCRFQEID